MNSLPQSIPATPPIEAILAEMLTPHAFQRWLESCDPNGWRVSALIWLLTYIRGAIDDRGVGIWPLTGDSVPVGSFFICDQGNMLRYTVFPFPAWARQLMDDRDWDYSNCSDVETFEPRILALVLHANLVIDARKRGAA